MSYILALIIFSAIVIFHELGHFLLAKWNGIEVIEFSLGMGPRLLSHVWGDTRYSLKLLPIGGSCQMVGEEEASDSEGAFGNKSVWARIAVVAAGPVFNFILAWVLALIIVGSVGYDNTMVDIIPDSAAAEAGMEDGDQIISINGSRTWLYREVSLYSSLHQGQTATVVFERNGEKQTVVLTPKQSDTGAYLYGFSRTVQREKGGALETVGYSCAEIRYWLKATVESLKMLIGGQVGLEEMSGPVGIVSTIGDTYKESRVDGWYYVTMNMIMIAILLSVNLGVMNLLPIPALDGGRLVFLILEAIRGKAIPQEKESMVHFTGFVLLMGLMAVILFSDLHKLFIK
ncbi:RIP metalloprotease RseP [Hominiventricola aquisgranensis]|jgi:regulator of sigma E protease|uniref:Zinc metalloprotease n=1 Tax=Hominiventricola aquisgranensis TaxID=3133164 RepID=A0ABV1HYL3_9FIRM|nr:RIP metalloprotease RseP [Clostridiaceae bacterium AF29-16BH]